MIIQTFFHLYSLQRPTKSMTPARGRWPTSHGFDVDLKGLLQAVAACRAIYSILCQNNSSNRGQTKSGPWTACLITCYLLMSVFGS